MDKMTPDYYRRVSDALVVWIGDGYSPYPARSEERLVSRFGSEATVELLPVLQRLFDEFNAFDAVEHDWDVWKMTEAAEACFRRNHPELPDEGVSTLAWYYSYANK
jgi:hypothetical protein